MQKEFAQADVQLMATVQECQKCLNPVKEGRRVGYLDCLREM